MNPCPPSPQYHRNTSWGLNSASFLLMTHVPDNRDTITLGYEARGFNEVTGPCLRAGTCANMEDKVFAIIWRTFSQKAIVFSDYIRSLVLLQMFLEDSQSISQLRWSKQNSAETALIRVWREVTTVSEECFVMVLLDLLLLMQSNDKQPLRWSQVVWFWFVMVFMFSHWEVSVTFQMVSLKQHSCHVAHRRALFQDMSCLISNHCYSDNI